MGGGGAAEATGDDFPCCAPRITLTDEAGDDASHLMEPQVMLSLAALGRLEAHAVDAETERDAILADLRAAVQRMGLRGGVLPTVVITDIINRHTPEG